MSVIVQWDATFSVGNAELDQQHQKLLALCNEMAQHEAGVSKTVSRSRFHEILNELTLYSRQHFQTEESLLKQMGYAELAAQEEEHHAYDEKVADWAFDATLGELDLDDAQSFLANWWRNHILVSDMQYRPLMEGKR